MGENIEFNKTVYRKGQYEKTIDTNFNELGTQTAQESINEEPTVNEFFELYSQLFYQIPETGDINSHEFLIKESSEYINFNEENKQIEALRAEIAQLRQDL